MKINNKNTFDIMKEKKITLTESQLHDVIAESIKEYIKESEDEYGDDRCGVADTAIEDGLKSILDEYHDLIDTEDEIENTEDPANFNNFGYYSFLNTNDEYTTVLYIHKSMLRDGRVKAAVMNLLESYSETEPERTFDYDMPEYVVFQWTCE